MPKDLSGSQVGINRSKGVNNPRPNNQRGRNVFPQSYKFLTTNRYGEISPFFWVKCERGDVQNLASTHDLHTFTLSSPMVCDVTMNKTYIKVPMQAIYPRTWEKQFTIPTQGDDIPADARAMLNVEILVQSLFELLNKTSTSLQTRLMAFVLLESICSDGGLLPHFNMHLGVQIYDDVNGEYLSFDSFVESQWSSIIQRFVEVGLFIEYAGHTYMIEGTSVSPSQEKTTISPRRFIEILRTFDFNLFDINDSSDLIDTGNFLFDGQYKLLSMYKSDNGPVDNPYANYLNIEPLLAYQLACAQFATNDFVDFIYSAQLFRDAQQSYATSVIGRFPTFLYNGVQYQYDVFSCRVFTDIIDNSSSVDFLNFFYNIFSFRKSLRYGDYFTGGKPQPLAVGEYSAPVTNNEVSAIDVTRSIQMQRLLHRVNMVGRKFGDFLAGIYGGQLPEAPKDVPIFLAHQRFDIKGFETENTSTNQKDSQSITSHLRSSESRHAFEVEINEPCYIIGMNSYEVLRVYSKTMDRFAFHHDRYDDFIPEMQYIGDQDIMHVELDSTHPDAVLRRPFAYALRYMEYKQRYSYAAGGFISNLPSWSFITDNKDGNYPEWKISPSYIRSSPSEFDRFYSSLTGYGLASYFHFIVAHTNLTSPVRQMEYTPEILK